MENTDYLQELVISRQLAAVMETNTYTEEYGLLLTKEEATELVRERFLVLKEQQRVEFGEGILPKLIEAFYSSAYISQDDYFETLCRLQEIFYMYKNESMDSLTDDDLIDYMKNAFENECEGSLEYLEEVSLERFARAARANTRLFIDKYALGRADRRDEE